MAFPHFYQCASQALTRYNCNCNGRHCCELRNCWTTPPSLIALLQRHLYIEVEGMADVFRHSDHLKEWYSPYRGDVSFGAKYDFFTQELAGRNTYINPPFNTYQLRKCLTLCVQVNPQELSSSSQFLKESRAICMRLSQKIKVSRN